MHQQNQQGRQSEARVGGANCSLGSNGRSSAPSSAADSGLKITNMFPAWRRVGHRAETIGLFVGFWFRFAIAHLLPQTTIKFPAWLQLVQFLLFTTPQTQSTDLVPYHSSKFFQLCRIPCTGQAKPVLCLTQTVLQPVNPEKRKANSQPAQCSQAKTRNIPEHVTYQNIIYLVSTNSHILLVWWLSSTDCAS